MKDRENLVTKLTLLLFCYQVFAILVHQIQYQEGLNMSLKEMERLIITEFNTAEGGVHCKD